MTIVRGVRVVLAWTVIDGNGEVLPRFIAASPPEVGRKVVRKRFDAFRLEASPSHRELFDCDPQSVLAREDWRIVQINRRIRRRRRSAEQLELN